MEETMTKAKLLGLMRDGRAEMEALVSNADKGRMDRPSSLENWSLKDLLAHISAWDRWLLAWLEAEARGEPPGLPAPGMTEEEVDRFNARTYDEWRDKPLEVVLGEFRGSFEALMGRAEAATEAVLLDPNHFPWTRGRPIRFYFAANSFWHYEEHLDQVRREVGAV